MVEFYTPWCGHCRGFAKDYTRAAAELKNDGIVLAKVSLDDPKNHPLAAQFGVQGFPTIRIFKRMYDSPPQPYGATVENFDTQPRTYESVVQHMRDLGSPPERIENLERLQSYLQTHVRNTATEVSAVAVGLFPDQSSPRASVFFEARFGRAPPPLRYVWTSDRKILEGAGLLSPSDELAGGEAVVLVTDFKDDPEGPIYRAPVATIQDIDALVRWLDVRSGPVLWRYSNELSSQITTGKLQRFLWAFANRATPFYAKYEEAMMAVAKENREEMKFVLIDETFQPLLDFFKIDKDQLPQLLVIDLHPEVGQRQFKFGKFNKKRGEWDTSSARNVDPAVLSQFIKDYRAEKLQRYLRTEPRSLAGTTGESAVVKVVGSTFEETIRSGKDVIISFYGDFSWCEHCKIYEPEWELIAKYFKPVTSLVVAKMDFQSNDIEDAKKRGIQPTGFPEVYMFRAGEHDKPPIKFDPEKYNNERGLKAVTEFIKQYAALPFGDSTGAKFGGRRRDEL